VHILIQLLPWTISVESNNIQHKFNPFVGSFINDIFFHSCAVDLGRHTISLHPHLKPLKQSTSQHRRSPQTQKYLENHRWKWQQSHQQRLG